MEYFLSIFVIIAYLGFFVFWYKCGKPIILNETD